MENRQMEENLDYKIELLRTCEEYLNDITFELELYAAYIEKDREIRELKELLDSAIVQEQKWKRQYNDLANSKMGKLQRLWWRICKKILNRKG